MVIRYKKFQICKSKYCINEILLWVVICFSLTDSLLAQDLEPRFLSPAPVGMNFVILKYSSSVTLFGANFNNIIAALQYRLGGL